MSNVEEFVVWANALGTVLPVASELSVSVTKDSAFVDVEAPDGSIGRLIYWENGSADCSIYNATGELVDFTQTPGWKPWDRVTPEEFDFAFARFIDAVTAAGRAKK